MRCLLMPKKSMRSLLSSKKSIELIFRRNTRGKRSKPMMMLPRFSLEFRTLLQRKKCSSSLSLFQATAA